METSASALASFEKIKSIMTIAGTALPAISLVVGGHGDHEHHARRGRRADARDRRPEVARRAAEGHPAAVPRRERRRSAPSARCSASGSALLGAKIISWKTPLPAAVAPWSLVVATLLGTVVGITSGVYPARRAVAARSHRRASRGVSMRSPHLGDPGVRGRRHRASTRSARTRCAPRSRSWASRSACSSSSRCRPSCAASTSRSAATSRRRARRRSSSTGGRSAGSVAAAARLDAQQPRHHDRRSDACSSGCRPSAPSPRTSGMARQFKYKDQVIPRAGMEVYTPNWTDVDGGDIYPGPQLHLRGERQGGSASCS